MRGVVATDALIGTFADLHDPSLVQNRCFLYHLIGNGTGEWRVPVGGMGAVTRALLATATKRGAEVLTGASVSGHPSRRGRRGGHLGRRGRHSRGAGPAGALQRGAVGAARSCWVTEQPHVRKPAGSQLKINFLLSRLPRLRSGDDPDEAFAGTLHVAEEYSALRRRSPRPRPAASPPRPPGEFYCHSLTDPSILGRPGRRRGAHADLLRPAHARGAVPPGPCRPTRRGRRRALAAVDVHLDEPLLDCVLVGPDGRPCIEAKVPQDVEDDLAMPGGHIFHGDLAWPWATDRRPSTPPPSSGASRPTSTPCCSAAPAPAAAAQ